MVSSETGPLLSAPREQKQRVKSLVFTAGIACAVVLGLALLASSLSEHNHTDELEFEAKDFVEPWKRPLLKSKSSDLNSDNSVNLKSAIASLAQVNKPTHPSELKMKIPTQHQSLAQQPNNNNNNNNIVNGKVILNDNEGKQVTNRPTPVFDAKDLVAPVGVSSGYNNWLDRLPFGNRYKKQQEARARRIAEFKKAQKTDPSVILGKARYLNEKIEHRVEYLKKLVAKKLAQPKSIVVTISRPGVKGDRGPVGPKGLPGKQGPVGIAGPAGGRGAVGNPGPPGAPGKAGQAGPQGVPGGVGADGRNGPQGLPGIQGRQGETGPRGDRAPPAEAGPRGPTGPQGETGPTGAVGDRGIRGPQGPPGPNRRPAL